MLHHRARQRGRRRGHRGAALARRRPVRRGHHRRPRRLQRRPDQRQPAPVARAGEGRHAHGHRRRRQRRLGPGRQTCGQAGVAAARGHDAGADRQPRRLPLSRRCADPGARRWRSCAPPGTGGTSGLPSSRATATRPTPRRPAGSATPTRSSSSCPGRRSPTDSRQIKLKVGADVDVDARRLALAREAVGPSVRIAVDANQRWGVARGDQRDRGPWPVGSVLGRGAHQPGRDSRAGRDPRRDRDRSRSRPASTSRTA